MLTEIVFVLDESGSMSDLQDDTIGGFNSMIDVQKHKEGSAYVSTVLFNNDSKVVHDRVDINEVKKMTKDDYVPSGCTALMDALGDSIRHIANIHKYARKEDVPDNTLFIIITDGMENASHKYSSADIKKLIKKQQEEYHWEFIYLAANIDAIDSATSYGINKDNAVNYESDSYGTKLNYETVGTVISSVRAQGTIDKDWKDNIEKHHKKHK